MQTFSFGKSLYYVCLTPFDIEAHIITYSSVQSFYFIFTILNTILLIINNTIKIRHIIQYIIMQYILIHLISIEIDIFFINIFYMYPIF